jgi:hypothetical protein
LFSSSSKRTCPSLPEVERTHAELVARRRQHVVAVRHADLELFRLAVGQRERMCQGAHRVEPRAGRPVVGAIAGARAAGEDKRTLVAEGIDANAIRRSAEDAHPQAVFPPVGADATHLLTAREKGRNRLHRADSLPRAERRPVRLEDLRGISRVLGGRVGGKTQ